MLVLSRTRGQQVVIGKDIVVTVNRIAGNRVTLGIEAPQGIRILRGELAEADRQAEEWAETGSLAGQTFEITLPAHLSPVS